MNSTLYLSFIGTVFIICITPGPSVLLATANSMNHGSKKAIGTILGDLSANTIQFLYLNRKKSCQATLQS